MSGAAGVVLIGVGASLMAAPAQAATTSPWWHLVTSTRPSVLPTGGHGTIVVQGTNIGDAGTSGPISLRAVLPSGVSVVEEEVEVEEGVFEDEAQVSFVFFHEPYTPPIWGTNGFLKSREFCRVTGQEVRCGSESQKFPGLEVPEEKRLLLPYQDFEMQIEVEAEASASAAFYEAEVSGGTAAPVSRRRPLSVGEGGPTFGAEDLALVPEEEGGAIDTHAGSHPFQLTATFNLNQGADAISPPAVPKDLHFKLPPGQLGNVLSLPQCTPEQFSTLLSNGPNLCPPDTSLGVAAITINENLGRNSRTYPVPLFNLEPRRGEPARFGFEVLQAPVILDTALRSGPGEDYGVTVDASNITEVSNFLSSSLTFWGAPGDPRHDESRGWGCVAGGYTAGEFPCVAPNEVKAAAFLTLPTDCSAPFATSVEGISWPTVANPAGALLAPFAYSLHDEAGAPLGLTGCNQLPFAPKTTSEPTSSAATSPTGLNFDLDVNDEGLLNSEGSAQSQLKEAVVTLPEGFTTNPSVAEGLKACSQAEFESATVEEGTGCLNESKIGDVEIESPLVKPIVHGSLYVAKQGENPNHNLLTIYMIARNEEIGVLIRQAGRVDANEKTGQLTTTFDNIPQLPFSHFRLSFRQGQRSPLVTPPACGDYTVNAELYPWSNPTVPLHEESSFKITQGPEGQGCPSGGVPPFHPVLQAGSENPTAGAFSPFYTDITRRDSEQEITRFSIKLPPGVIGKLAGVSSCSDAAIATAKAREKEGGGQEELNSPSCPANSEVGHSNVGSGVGNVLAYAPGKLYLAGPYHGSNLSIISITAAKVGPFDLGTVVVRFALRIDPETAEVFVDSQGSDPIPHIVDGIPVHLRDIQAFVDRPNFTLNPTSCKKKSTASTVLGSGLNFASEADDQPVTITSPFQVGSCASLGFHPNLALSLKGATKRGGTPAFKAVLTYPKGSYANIAKSVVTLPHSEFLEQSHIKTICTRVQFKEGKVPGEKCPKASIYGKATAITPLLDEPLKGPVYLRSSSHNLPDLVAALHNNQVDFALDGRIDSVKNGRIRNTFETVPDAPVSKFVLEMQGGKKGLLVNSTNLCKAKSHAISEFTGQNGKLHNTNPVLSARCGGKGKKKSKSKK